MTTGREIILTALEGEEPPRVPVMVWGGGMWAVYRSGASIREVMDKPEAFTRCIVDMYERVPYDAVFVGSGVTVAPLAALGAEIEYPEGSSPANKKALIKSLDEVESLDPAALAEDPVVRAVWETAGNARAALGERALVTAVSWGPFSIAGRLASMDQVMMAMIDTPEKVHRLVEKSMEIVWRYMEPMVGPGLCEAAAIADPTASGNLISKPFFEEFALPYLKELVSRLRAKGAPVFLHICGQTKDRLAEIAAAGVSCFSADQVVPLGEAKKALAGKACLAGSVPPVDVMLNGSPEDVRRSAEACLGQAAAGGGFILCTGCDVPAKVPEANLQALLGAVNGGF